MASDSETVEEKQPQPPAKEVKGDEEHEGDVEVKEKAEVDEEVGNEDEEEKGSGNEEKEEKGSGNDEEAEKGSGNVEVKDEKERMEVDKKSEEEEKLEGEKKGSTKKGKGKGKKKEKERASPVTPAIDRPTRERKIVERYTVTSASRSTTPKPFSIEKVSTHMNLNIFIWVRPEVL